MATQTRKVTRRQAETVLASVRKAYGVTSFDSYGPKIVEDFDWSSSKPLAIVWEEGPFDWALEAQWHDAPKGVFLEAVTGWAVGLYRD